MKIQIFLHSTELLLAILFIVIKWPFYEGAEYISNFVYCAIYIILFLLYFGISSLIPAMKLACDLNGKKDITIKTIIISQTPWLIFVFIILYVFQDSLGTLSCIPIVFPNCFLFISELLIKLKKSDNHEITGG